MPKSRLLSETEWRSMGVQQSRGWQHYAIHRYVSLHGNFARIKSHDFICRPEPHILLFRRPLGTDPQTGQVDQELLNLALEDYKDQPGLSHRAIMN